MNRENGLKKEYEDGIRKSGKKKFPSRMPNERLKLRRHELWNICEQMKIKAVINRDVNRCQGPGRRGEIDECRCVEMN